MDLPFHSPHWSHVKSMCPNCIDFWISSTLNLILWEQAMGCPLNTLLFRNPTLCKLSFSIVSVSKMLSFFFNFCWLNEWNLILLPILKAQWWNLKKFWLQSSFDPTAIEYTYTRMLVQKSSGWLVDRGKIYFSLEISETFLESESQRFKIPELFFSKISKLFLKCQDFLFWNFRTFS